MALDQPRSAVPPKAHSEVVKNELRKIDDEEIYDSLCEYTQVYIVTVSAQKIAPYWLFMGKKGIASILFWQRWYGTIRTLIRYVKFCLILDKRMIVFQEALLVDVLEQLSGN